MKKTKHHIIPKSRGGKGIKNVIKVDKELHDKYHLLFGNKTPNEIITFLNKEFKLKVRR